MPLDKRIITLKDQEILYRRPIEQLSNFELFSVVEIGARLGPSLNEILRRLKTDSYFIEEMFEFGDLQAAAIGSEFKDWFSSKIGNTSRIEIPTGRKFRDWFSSHIGDTPRIEASIISEISKSEKFGDKAQNFMPHDLKPYFDGFTDAKKFKVIETWLTCLEFPEKFFQSSQGMITPVILSIKHLPNYDCLADINKGLGAFFARYYESGAGGTNCFATGDLRETLRKLVEIFLNARARPFDEIVEFISLLSRFDNKNFMSSINDDFSDGQKLFSSRLVSDEFLERLFENRLKCKPSTKDILLDEINSERSYRILSKFYSRSELMNAGRKVRSYLLGDGLGI